MRSRVVEDGARWGGAALLAAACALTATDLAAADGTQTIDSGSTAWILTSTALVLLMTLPGLALFYGGLVRAKNVLSILMQCMISAGAVGVLWVLVGYSLAFSGDGPFIGNLDAVGLMNIDAQTVSGEIPAYVYVMFQSMFAIITPALMIGAFAERMRFGPYLAFICIWLLVVYVPLAHMVWDDDGFIGITLGAKDFAGGLVVHMSSGFSALTAAIVLGKRQGFGREPMPPHSLPLTVIGAGLLWVGWFGFNAGSALAANAQAGLAFLTTQTAAATAVVVWAGIEVLHQGKPTVLGAATAAVAGLVAITPACAFVTPLGAIGVGAGASLVCYAAVTLLKPAWGYDDSLDVFGVHGVGGMWGALATGLFIADFALDGTTWAAQIGKQVVSIGIVAVFATAASWLILTVLRGVFGSLRATDEEEHAGLDLALHSESAYSLQPAGAHLSSGGHGSSEHGANEPSASEGAARPQGAARESGVA